MARFHYRALLPDGRSVEGQAEAADERGLADLLGAGGRILVDARALDAGRSWRALLTPSLDPRQVTGLLAELGLLLRGGQRIDEALGLLAEGRTGGIATTIRTLRTDIVSGRALADAFAAQPAAFPPDVVALLRVAESTGRLDRAVEAAAEQRERSQALAEKLGGALRYPLVLMLVAIGVLLFFLLFVIPQFSGIIRDAGGQPGWAIGTAIALSDGLRAHLERIEIAALVAVAGCFSLWRLEGPRRRLLSALARLPIVAGILELRRATLFCMTLATLLGQGVTMPRALKVLAEVLGRASAARMERIGDAVRRGASLSDALEGERFLPPVVRRMLRIGEESGELEAVAAQAGRLFEKKLQLRLERVTAIVGPAAIVAIAGLIGGLMVTIMTALIDINQMVL